MFWLIITIKQLSANTRNGAKAWTIDLRKIKLNEDN